MLRPVCFGLLLLPGLCAADVPLVQGLTVTTAVAETDGDYESRKHFAAREGEAWRLRYSASVPAAGGAREVSSERIVHDADLRSARSYRNRFEAGTEEDYPGTSALGASAEVLNELKTTGKARFALVGEDRWLSRALGGADGGVLDLAGALMSNSNLSFKGELQKRSAGTLGVLVNGLPQALPVLVAGGRFTAKNGQAMDAELSLLDDAANPIALEWRIGSARLRVVRLDYPQPQGSGLAARLRENKRVSLPGLHFDFGSARLKPESAASLPVIVEAARAAPGALLLEGHTDNLGHAAANQALSLARAQAVRTALIELDASLASRLSAQGYGATRPQAGNSTLEGRAQNRRVELALP